MKLEEIPDDKITWKEIESYYKIQEIYNKNIIFVNVKNNSNFDVLYSIINISHLDFISSIELYNGIYTKIMDINVNKNGDNNTIIKYPLYQLNNFYNLKLKITFTFNVIPFISNISISYKVADIECNIRDKVIFDLMNKNANIKYDTYEITLRTNVFLIETGHVYKMTLIYPNEFYKNKYYKICFGNDIKIYNNNKTSIFVSNSNYQDVRIEFYNKNNCFLLEPIRPANKTDYIKITSEQKGIYELNNSL